MLALQGTGLLARFEARQLQLKNHVRGIYVP